MNGDLKTIEQLLDASIAIEVDVGVRMAVARQELFDAKRAGRMTRAENQNIAKTLCNQLHPPEDVGSHENLAKFGVGLYEIQQVLAVDLDYFACLLRTHPDQNAASKENADLTRELARQKQS